MRPILAIELLSPSTRDEDLGQRQPRGPQTTKWQVYEQILRIPYYVVFDRSTNELQVFQLVGNQYQQQPLDAIAFGCRPWKSAEGYGRGSIGG